MDDREALRRRLYAPGADQRDVAAYRGIAGRVGPRVRVRRPRRRVLLLGAVLLVAVAVVTAILLVPRRAAEAAAVPVPLSAADRSELLENLRSVGAAGIAAYLVTHPSPPQLAGGTGFTTRELQGEGAGVRRIDASGTGGSDRVTVLLVTDGDGRASWTAQRLATRRGGRVVVLRTTAARTQDGPPGTLTATTFPVRDGAAPVRLRVDVADGVRWGAAVVFSRSARAR